MAMFSAPEGKGTRDSDESPKAILEIYVDQIRIAIDSGAYMPALATLLTVPDICAALSSDNGKTSGPKYRQWLIDYAEYDVTTAKSLWWYRCSLLHEGSIRPTNPGANPLIFIPPVADYPQVGGMGLLADGHGEVHVESIPSLYNKTWDGVQKWIIDVGSTGRVMRNLEKTVHLRPRGLEPWIDGWPVIA